MQIPADRLCRASGYTDIGTVCNLAARLYAEAKDGTNHRRVAVEQTIRLEQVGTLTLKET
jgi:hypothetical protein